MLTYLLTNSLTHSLTDWLSVRDEGEGEDGRTTLIDRGKEVGGGGGARTVARADVLHIVHT